MNDLVGRIVYVADTSDYDNRGGQGTVYATLDAAKAAHPRIAEWEHSPPTTYADGYISDEEWVAVCPRPNGWSAGDSIPVIVAQTIR